MKCGLQIGISCYLLIIAVSSRGQVPGCTDPLANNYDPSATVNDGSCLYDPYSVSPTHTFSLDDQVMETSGLILWDGYVWTHNDNADETLYGLDPATAEIRKKYSLKGVVNKDWEEIQQDDQYIYIGDIGNNSGNRTDLHILRIHKLSLKSGNPVIDTIWFSYSDQVDLVSTGAYNSDYDCEAFIVSEDSIYLFTKQWISAKTSVYSLPKVPGSYSARKIYSYNIQGLITGAAFMDSYGIVVLCGYTSLLQPFLYLLFDFPGDRFFDGNKRRITVSLPFHQIEGITTDNGQNYYLTNESFTLQPVANNPQKLHLFDLREYLNGYLLGSKEKNEPHLIEVFPNPAGNSLTVKITKELLPIGFKILDQSARKILEGILNYENSVIDITHLKPGSYILSIGEHFENSLHIVKL